MTTPPWRTQSRRRRILPDFPRPIDDEPSSGLFVFDTEKAAAKSKDAFLARLLTFINTDHGHAPDRNTKLGI